MAWPAAPSCIHADQRMCCLTLSNILVSIFRKPRNHLRGLQRREVSTIWTRRWLSERRATHRPKRVLPAILRTNDYLPTCCKVVQQLHGVLWREVLKEHVIDLDHRRVHAGPKALHLCEGPRTALARFTNMDPQVGLDRMHDVIRSTNHAWRCSTQLDVELAELVAIVHGEEGGHLVDVHVRAAQPVRDGVHGRERHPASPPLRLGERSGVLVGLLVLDGRVRLIELLLHDPKQRHDRRLFPLLRVGVLSESECYLLL
mmetsp:Transcript_29319/g.71207  ORF Transcript_29319/g.71207 Transcript_29319/m.71207 type:complete len:258 (+) Transcript_29319:208-981(+)